MSDTAPHRVLVDRRTKPARRSATPTVLDTADARKNSIDRHPHRRIDRWLGSWHLPRAAVAGFRVIDQSVAGIDPKAASDHLPAEVTIDPGQLAR